jgi:hypothetical protein
LRLGCGMLRIVGPLPLVLGVDAPSSPFDIHGRPGRDLAGSRHGSRWSWRTPKVGRQGLRRDDDSNRHRAWAHYLSMIFSQNRQSENQQDDGTLANPSNPARKCRKR